jgi:hypothetical protein
MNQYKVVYRLTDSTKYIRYFTVKSKDEIYRWFAIHFSEKVEFISIQQENK